MSKVLTGTYTFMSDDGIESGTFPLTVVPEANCTTAGRKAFMKKAKLRNPAYNGIVEIDFPKAGLQVKACIVDKVAEAYSVS